MEWKVIRCNYREGNTPWKAVGSISFPVLVHWLDSIQSLGPSPRFSRQILALSAKLNPASLTFHSLTMPFSFSPSRLDLFADDSYSSPSMQIWFGNLFGQLTLLCQSVASCDPEWPWLWMWGVKTWWLAVSSGSRQEGGCEWPVVKPMVTTDHCWND